MNRANLSGKENLLFKYDANGNRVLKQVTKGAVVMKTWYIRDAQGNVMAVYEQSTDNGSKLTLKEHHLYGSSRLGVAQRNIDMTTVPVTGVVRNEETGNKQYELTCTK